MVCLGRKLRCICRVRAHMFPRGSRLPLKQFHPVRSPLLGSPPEEWVYQKEAKGVETTHGEDAMPGTKRSRTVNTEEWKIRLVVHRGKGALISHAGFVSRTLRGDSQQNTALLPHGRLCPPLPPAGQVWIPTLRTWPPASGRIPFQFLLSILTNFELRKTTKPNQSKPLWGGLRALPDW